MDVFKLLAEKVRVDVCSYVLSAGTDRSKSQVKKRDAASLIRAVDSLIYRDAAPF